MIVDKISNIMQYEPMLNNLKKGMDAIAALGENPELGRYEFDGGYFMVQKGLTKPMEEGTFEAHRKYVDVQMVIEGSEELAWHDIADLSTAIPYNPEKDQERFTGTFEHVMKISAGMFYAAFPKDGHKAISHTAQQQSYTKIVLKLPVSTEGDD